MGEVPEALRSSVVLFLSYKDIIICHSVETERGALALSVFSPRHRKLGLGGDRRRLLQLPAFLSG